MPGVEEYEAEGIITAKYTDQVGSVKLDEDAKTRNFGIVDTPPVNLNDKVLAVVLKLPTGDKIIKKVIGKKIQG